MDEETLDGRAERLKERVCVTFAALAVVMTMRGHVTGSGAAARTLGAEVVLGGAVVLRELAAHH